MLKRGVELGLLILAMSSGHVAADTLTLSFDNRETLDSATAIWNHAAGEIHPPLSVYGYDDGTNNPNADRDLDGILDLGDGSHGAFEASRYHLFDTDGDPGNGVIVIDTDAYPDGLMFTSFTLDAGVTIRPTGSRPLIIKSLTSITVSGTIDCSGGNGANGDAVMGAGAALGGVGRCGGPDGGAGGWHNGAVVDATAGTNVSGSLTGGQPGLNFGGAGGAGGGGGGAPRQLGSNISSNGEDPNSAGAPVGGTAGSSDSSDVLFLGYDGGAGGGGGAYDPNGARGGGGGAGGGTVVLLSQGDILVNVGGRILANGGNGGAPGLAAGGGGGGGAGSVLIYSGGVFTDDNLGAPPFSISAERGVGGVSGGGLSDGGVGADGRIWFTDRSGNPSSNNTEWPALYMGYLGLVRGRTAVTPWVATTTVFDLQSTYPIFNSASLVGTFTTNNTAAIYVATGATSDFNPTWVLASTLAGQKISQYVRFQVRIDQADATQAMARVQSLVLDYTRPRIDDFSFTAAGCGRVESSGGGLKALLPIFVLFFGVLAWRRQLKGSHR